MGLYLITYDLRRPGRNYTQLYDLLGETWKGKRVAESVWLAVLKGPADAVRDLIRAVVDSNDRVVVIELKVPFDWATFRAIPGGAELLKQCSP